MKAPKFDMHKDNKSFENFHRIYSAPSPAPTILNWPLWWRGENRIDHFIDQLAKNHDSKHIQLGQLCFKLQSYRSSSSLIFWNHEASALIL